MGIQTIIDVVTNSIALILVGIIIFVCYKIYVRYEECGMNPLCYIKKSTFKSRFKRVDEY